MKNSVQNNLKIYSVTIQNSNIKSKVILRTKQSLLDTPLSPGMPGLFVAKKHTNILSDILCWKKLFDMNQATQF